MKLEPLGGNQNDGLFRAETGVIYFRKYREGKGEIFRSTKTKDLTIARRVRARLMAELWGDKPKTDRRNTIGELWPIWRDGKVHSNKRKATIASIDATGKNLEPLAFDKFPDDITETWWLTVYIPEMRAKPHPKTGRPNPKRKFMNDRKWLVSFLRSLNRQGLLAKVPVIVNPDPEREKGRVYSDETMAKLYDEADWLLLAKLIMGTEHFMRRSEIALMSKSRIDRQKRTIHLRAEDTKIKKERTFAYNESLEWLFVILDWRAEKLGIKSEWLFPSPGSPEKSILKDGFNSAWRACKRRAGLTGKNNFHWLRHTGLSKAFGAQGANAALICHAAGLSLEEAQRTYLHYTADDTRQVVELVRF